jgi:hypothetical protein
MFTYIRLLLHLFFNVPRWVKSKGAIYPRHIIVELVRRQMGGHERACWIFLVYEEGRVIMHNCHA